LRQGLAAQGVAVGKDGGGDPNLDGLVGGSAPSEDVGGAGGAGGGGGAGYIMFQSDSVISDGLVLPSVILL